MSKVIANGYIGVSAPDLDEWRSFATEVLGAEVAPGSGDDALYLRIDERAWRICVQLGPGGFAFSGWEVASGEALDELVAELDAHEIPHREDPDLAKARSVSRLVSVVDPGGNELEFFCGARVPQAPFVSPTGARFVTSHKGPGDMGFGHSVHAFPDAEAAKHFYFDVLGFRLSDTLNISIGEWSMVAYFAHVNPRHHSLAFVQGPGSAIDHFSLEVEDLDMVGRALDRVNERGLKIHMSLGKHTNDHMVSFYVVCPSGFSIEYGTAGRLIDDDGWTVSTYDAGSFWGHQFFGALPPEVAAELS